MEKQAQRYTKTKKKLTQEPEVKKERELKLSHKLLIVSVMFILCIGAIVAIVLLLVKKYHS
ncbi:hypothetical protein [Ureaplasma ceti]|uniref:Uncharacterized protein n=1 Tax=Ureaplasma ceti TaxID=3119530 RepID=A0ABP9U5I0_9BACT